MNKALLGLVCLTALSVSACGSDSSDSDSAVPAELPSAGAPADVEAPTGDSADVLASMVPSCEALEPHVAPYIEALVLEEGSTVDEWGVTCRWVPAEGETNMDNNRNLDIGISVNEPGSEAPDLSLMGKIEGFSELEDGWLETKGGYVYGIDMGVDVASVYSGTVWLPEFTMQIAGAQWGRETPLDNTAALKLTQAILGS